MTTPREFSGDCVPETHCPDCGQFLPSEAGQFNARSHQGNLISYRCKACGALSTAVDYGDRGLAWFAKPEPPTRRRANKPAEQPQNRKAAGG